MKSVAIALSLAVVLASCSLSVPPTPDARATEAAIAGSIFATLTAAAPTLAPTKPTETIAQPPIAAPPTAAPTSTPTATWTPTPSLTPRPTSIPLPSNTPGQTSLIFSDDFSGTCALRERDNEEHTFKCQNGEYMMVSKLADYSWWNFYDDEYVDVVIEADARVPNGDDGVMYGIVFRAASDASGHYQVALSPMGGFAVDAYDQGSKWTSLIPYTESAAVRRGVEKNHIKVIVQGDQIAVYINNQFMGSVLDSTRSRGSVGFIMWSRNAGGQAAFSNLTISKINRPIELPTAKARPTPLPTLAAGMGGIVVDNFCGFDVTITVGGQFAMIPVKGRIILSLPPGKYTVSATAPGQRLGCGGGGCGLEVVEGQYTPYPYCAGPFEE